MSEIELTRQQLDPVGALPTRILAIVLAAGAFAYGIIMTARAADQIVNPLLAVLALVWLGGASLTLAVASSPRRAPFTATTHSVIQLFALGAVALSAASQWGANRFIQDDFGSISFGLLMLGMGVYRPARELASGGVLAAIFVGFITLLEVPSLVSAAPPVAFVLVGMTPVLAMSFAAAAYSGNLVDALQKWQRQAALSVAYATPQLAAGITRAVRHDRVAILDHDVFPFFTSILTTGAVTAADRLRARQIADSIRALMVAEADRTWLEVISTEDGVAPDVLHLSVIDAEGRATGMVGGQRTVLRALIVAVREDPEFVRDSLNVTITGSAMTSHGVVTATMSSTVGDPQEIYAPYVAVMRIVFTDVNVNYRDNQLKVRFSYEQR